MPKINLAQETMRNQAVARRRKVVYFFSIIVLVVIGMMYLGIVLLTKNTENKVADVGVRIKSLEAQLKTLEPYGKEIKAFNLRLANMDNLLKSHIRWSTALSELERLVLPSVSVVSLNGGAESKEIVMDVRVPNIETAADLVVSLENEAKNNKTFFNNVVASALESSKNTGSNMFSTKLRFGLKPEGLLEKDSSSVSTDKVSENISPSASLAGDSANQLNPL